MENPRTHSLLARWDAWSDRQLWRRTLANRSKAKHHALAERKLAELESATALDALAANVELVKLMTGWRWQAMKAAREDGATWEQIGDVLGVSKQGALNAYTRAIEAQEKYAADFHDAAAARAVLGDDEGDERLTAEAEAAAFIEGSTPGQAAAREALRRPIPALWDERDDGDGGPHFDSRDALS